MLAAVVHAAASGEQRGLEEQRETRSPLRIRRAVLRRSRSLTGLRADPSALRSILPLILPRNAGLLVLRTLPGCHTQERARHVDKSIGHGSFGTQMHARPWRCGAIGPLRSKVTSLAMLNRRCRDAISQERNDLTDIYHLVGPALDSISP